MQHVLTYNELKRTGRQNALFNRTRSDIINFDNNDVFINLHFLIITFGEVGTRV